MPRDAELARVLPWPDWAALFLLCSAQFLVILDTSIVGIALPALQRALGFDAAGLQWIFNAYVVAFGGLLLLGGDIGGGMQVGVASLVDLRTGQVVWHNLLIDQTGDLRNLQGARETAGDLLKGVRGAPAVPAQ